MFYCPSCKNSLEQQAEAYFCPHCVRSFAIVDGIPSFINQDSISDSFSENDFQSLNRMEQKHFWHIGRKEIILDFIQRNIGNWSNLRMLEIGCGNGNILSFLKQNKINIEGGDICLDGLKLCKQREHSVLLYQVDALSLPFYENYEVVGLFDVLEHIDDDEKVISEVSRTLVSNGSLLLTVPAYKCLWSYWDQISHHKRRYNKQELIEKLGRNGFVIRKVSSYMFLIFPLFAALRLFIGITKSGHDECRMENSVEFRTIPVINEVLLVLLKIEKWLMRYVNLPFGASIIVLADKTTRADCNSIQGQGN